MTFEQVVTDIGAGVAAIGAISTIIAHLPFMPPKYAEFFARISLYAANWKFSVNQRDTLPKDPAPAKAERMFPSDPPPPDFPSAAVLLLAVCFAFHSSACALFGSGGSFWPASARCLPSPASLLNQVERVLLNGGDYESALKDLALQDGAGVVECAVQTVVDLLTAKSGKLGASPETGKAAARGKAFLAKTGTKIEAAQ